MQIEILTDKGMPINLVRFFTLSEKQFLIFSSNDDVSDEQGHVTIHISEIMNMGRMTANNVSDIDWENIKNIIKGIVNANKNNQPLPIRDLDYNVLDGISVVGDRALKLMSNYVDLLKANQPVFEKEVVDNIIVPSEQSSSTFETQKFTSPTNLNSNLNSLSTNEFAQPAMQVTETIAVQPSVQESVVRMPEVSAAPVMPTVSESNIEMPSFDMNSVEVEQVAAVSPDFQNMSASNSNGIDYEKLYNEQVELVNRLQSEITNYKNKLETLKNIINN